MHASDEHLEPARLRRSPAGDRSSVVGAWRMRLAFADLRHALRAPARAVEPVEHRDRLVTRDAVGREGRRSPGTRRARVTVVGPKMPSMRPAIEPEHAETSLQLSDVVAALHRAAEVEEAVAELVARFDDRGPGLAIADAVCVEAACDLERAHGGLGGRAVVAVLTMARVEAGSREPTLKVADRLARRADAQRQTVYRNSPSSWRSWPLPLAPTSRFLAWPSLNTMSVGMLMTS